MAPAMRAGIERRSMAALSGGHFAVDFASGSVPAMIPFLHRLASISAMRSQLCCSWRPRSRRRSCSLLFGLWSDRRGVLWLIPGGSRSLLLGVGGAAISPMYPVVVVACLRGWSWSGAFHPEGAKFAAYASGPKRASGMSYFNIGGNVGYAMGAFAVGRARRLARSRRRVGGDVAGARRVDRYCAGVAAPVDTRPGA